MAFTTLNVSSKKQTRSLSTFSKQGGGFEPGVAKRRKQQDLSKAVPLAQEPPPPADFNQTKEKGKNE